MKIGYALFSLSSPWMVSYKKAFEEEMQQHPNFEVSWFDGNSVTKAIIPAIEKWISRKVDLVISYSLDHVPLGTTYKKALSMGIPVMLTVAPPDYRIYDSLSAFSGLNGWDSSRMAAELLNEALGGKGQIAYITGPTGSASEKQNTEGFTSSLQRLSSRIEIVATVDGRWDSTVTYLKTLDLLTRFPKISAVYAVDDTMGSAVIRALKEKGRSPGQVKVVAQGGSRGSITDLEQGWYLGIVNQDPKLCARQDVWLMTALLEEQHQLPFFAQVRQEMITKENVGSFPGW